MLKIVIDDSNENSDWLSSSRKEKKPKEETETDFLTKTAPSVVASLDSFLSKQLEACQPGYHSHPGRTCHPEKERHKGKAVAAMGGEQAYWTSHPFAKPKEQPAKKRRKGKAKPQSTAKPLSEKWFDTTEQEALLSQEFGSVDERKEAMLATVPEKWHDRVVFNKDVLNQRDPKIFATTKDWLFKYETVDPRTAKVNEHVVYSRHHQDKSEQAKWERLKTVSNELGRIRAYADELLEDENPQNQDIGAAIHLLDVTGFRVGGDRYVEENGTYGITSLERGHVKLLSKNTVVFSFVGKAGVKVEKRKFKVPTKVHEYLEKATKGRQDRPLLSVNDGHVRRAMEPFGIKPKDLRTFKVNMMLVKTLNEGPQYKGDRRKREGHLKDVVKAVAEDIGHQPSVSRKSYMHPLLLRGYLQGHAYPTLESLFKQVEAGAEKSKEVSYDKWITAEERRFMDYLDTIHTV